MAKSPFRVKNGLRVLADGATVVGQLSSSGLVTASGGNSDIWTSNYTLLNNASSRWDSTFSTVTSNSAEWATAYTTTKDHSATWQLALGNARGSSAYSTVTGNSAQWGSVYTSVSPNSSRWESNYITTTNTSGDWESTHASVYATSGDWESTHTAVYANSAAWSSHTDNSRGNSAYSTVTAGSAEWDSVYGSMSPNSGDWESTHTIVYDNSANWGDHVAAADAGRGNSAYSTVTGTSADWESTHTSVYDNSASWSSHTDNTWGVSVYATVTGTSGDWESTHTTVYDNSGSWGAANAARGNSVYSTVTGTSGDWESTHTTVYDNSASWSSHTDNSWGVSVYATVTSTSADWESTHAVVHGTSGDWESTHTAVYDNSASWSSHTDNTWGVSVYATVTGTSADWESTHTAVYDNSASWESTHTAVYDNSASWESHTDNSWGISVYATVTGTSGDWESTHTTTYESSGDWESTHTAVYDNSGSWGISNAGRGNSAYSTVTGASSNWNSTHTAVYDNSANWGATNAARGDSVYSTVTGTSSDWESTHTTVYDNSASWSSHTDNSWGVSVYATVTGTSGDWESTHTTVYDNSASWATQGDGARGNSVYSTVTGASSNWNSTNTTVYDNSASWSSHTDNTWGVSVYATVTGTSGDWESTHTTLNESSGDWESTHTAVYDNSASWSSHTDNTWGVSVYATVTGTSADWESTHTTVYDNSANWDSAYTNMGDQSGSWDSVYTSVSPNSGRWESVYTSVTGLSSTLWTETGPDIYRESNVVIGDTTPVEQLTVRGNVSASGGLSAADSIFLVGDQENRLQSESHLYVEADPGNESGNSDIIFTSDGTERMRILGALGRIGVGTTAPFEAFSVMGHISASGNVYFSGGQLGAESNRFSSIYSTVSGLSGRWESVYETSSPLTGRWESNYSTVTGNSAEWESAYTTTTANSGNWQTVYITSNNLSGKWESVYETTSPLSGKWESVYSSVKSTSGSWSNPPLIGTSYSTLTGNSGRWSKLTNTENFGASLWFNGSGDYVQISDTSTSSELFNSGTGGTIAAWILVKSVGENDKGTILDKSDSLRTGWLLRCGSESNGAVKLVFRQMYNNTDGIWETTSAIVPLSSWTHVAVSYSNASSASDPIFYVDGKTTSISEQQAPSGGDAGPDANIPLFVGNSTTPQLSAAFYGEIGGVHMFNTLKPAGEIYNLYLGNRADFPDNQASQEQLTSGVLTIGKKYRIDDFQAGDDFINVGAGSNATGIEFITVHNTPTTWTNGSIIRQIGCVGEWNAESIGNEFWVDVSGNTNHGIVSATPINQTMFGGPLGIGWTPVPNIKLTVGGSVSARGSITTTSDFLSSNTGGATFVDISDYFGETNTGSNIGTGDGVFAQKMGKELEFKTLKGGGATSITATANEITITSTDSDTTYSAGVGLDLTGTVFSHEDTSSQASSNNSGQVFIQSITLDTFGHITAITTGTATDTDTTYSAGVGLDLTGTVFSHEDTSSVADSTNTGQTFLQSITFDTFGHVQSISTGTATDTDTTYTAGGGLDLTGTVFSHEDTSSQASSNNSGQVFIQDITLDTYGHVTAIGTATATGGGGSQNLFETISVTGQSDVVADSTTDTLTLAGAGSVSITTDAGTDTITISAGPNTDTDTTYTAGGGLDLAGTVFSHEDTSSQASSDNSGQVFIQDITLDTYGHVTAIGTGTAAGGTVDGSGTANYITKWSDSDTLADSIMYESGSNIGIGTTGPSYTLGVAGGVSAAGLSVIGLVGTPASDSIVHIGTVGSRTGVSVHGAKTGGNEPSFYTLETTNNVTTKLGSETTFGELGTFSNHPVYFLVNNSAVGVFDTTGNLGVNTTAPPSRLSVGGSLSASEVSVVGLIGTPDSTSMLEIGGVSNRTGTGVKAAKSGSNIPTLFTEETGNTVRAKLQSGLTYGAVGTHTNHEFIFLTNNTERAIIKTDGKVGIGTSNPAEALTVAGNISASGDVIASNTSFKFADGTTFTTNDNFNVKSTHTTVYNTSATWGGGGTIDGSGTANYAAKWSDSDTLTDSVIYDTGSRIGVGATAGTTHTLTVSGPTEADVGPGAGAVMRITSKSAQDNHIRYDYPADNTKFWLAGVDSDGNETGNFIIWNSELGDPAVVHVEKSPARLTVAGDISARGDIIASNTSFKFADGTTFTSLDNSNAKSVNTTVNANSADWGGATSVYNTVNANSGTWANTFYNIGTDNTPTVDFTNGEVQTVAINGNCTFQNASNVAAGRYTLVRISCDGTSRTLTWPADWKFVGVEPAMIEANKISLVHITAFGSGQSDIVCNYALEE